MPVIGRSLDNHVDIITLQRLAKVRELRGSLAIPGKLLGGFVHVILIDVTDCHNVAKSTRILCVTASHPPATDQRDAWAVIRAARGFGRFLRGQFSFHKPEGQSGGSSNRGTSSNEGSARDLKRLVH